MDYYEDFLLNSDKVINKLDTFLDESINQQKPVLNQQPMDDLIKQMKLAEHIEAGDLSGQSLEDFVELYLENCTRLHHPGFLAQQVAATHPTGALGSLIDGITNNAMAIYEMGPAASAIEYYMINWLLSKVGWKTVDSKQQLDTESVHAGGTLTHGGSLGNLTALLAARSANLPNAWDSGVPANVVVLVPEQSHYSLKRTAGVLGIGATNCLAIRADTDGRVDPDGLAEQIVELKANGKFIMAIVANGCGTAVGLYDPIEEMANICEHHGIWLHLDAAHGGPALLSNKYGYLLNGIKRVDSIVWDAHKMMMTPTLCAAVLVRDHRNLDNAFQTEASYLLHEKDQPGYDFIIRNLECTKAGLGLRFFMSVAAQGEDNLVKFYEQVADLTQQTASWIREQADMDIAVNPQTNILCFRFAGSDQLQLDIRKEILAESRFYISTTAYQGKRWLRLVIMSPNSCWSHIKELLMDIRRIGENLS